MSWQDWDARELIQLSPTDDLGEARRRLQDYGYVVLKDVLAGDQLEAVRGRLREQAAAERALGIATLVTPGNSQSIKAAQAARKAGDEAGPLRGRTTGEDFHEQFVASLFNKGEEFWPLLLDPGVQALTREILGDDFLLSSWLGSVVNPGCPLMGLHTDQWFLGSPQTRGAAPGVKVGDITRAAPRPVLSNDPDGAITPAYSVQTIWMLTDFTEADGATRIIPKSNLSGAVPEPDVPHPYRSMPAEGRAGSVLLYDARLWHSSGEHRGHATRYALHGTFVGPQIRQMENFFLTLLPDVRRRLPKGVLEMLGYKIWWGYGRLGQLSQAGLVDPDTPPVGRLALAGS